MLYYAFVGFYNIAIQLTQSSSKVCMTAVVLSFFRHLCNKCSWVQTGEVYLTSSYSTLKIASLLPQMWSSIQTVSLSVSSKGREVESYSLLHRRLVNL